MKKIRIIFGLLVLASFTLSFVNSEDWFLFETKKCKLLFPKKPTESSQTVPSAIGDLELKMYMYEVTDTTKDDNLLYMLMETNYPDSLINSDKKDLLDNFFRNAIDGSANNVQGSKILTETKIELAGFPGREARVSLNVGVPCINKMHFYLVKNKMYILEVITDARKDFNKSMDKFMNSFALTN